MKWSSVLAQLRILVVTLSLGLAFCSLAVLAHHYFTAARAAVAERERIKSEMRGLIERLADVEASLNMVASYRKSIDTMTLTEFESVLDRTGLKESSEAGISTALRSHPIEGITGGESNEVVYTDALVYGGMIDRLANARVRANELSGELKGTAKLLGQRQQILASIPSIIPAKGWISSEFGVRESPFHRGTEKMHNGIDIAADPGTPVLASADGVVAFAGKNGGYGKFVKIDHGYGISTRYAHNSEFTVKKGDKVKRGQQIASIGNTGRSTGPHLHYEIMIHDQPVNPRRFFFGTKPEDMQPKDAPARLASAVPMGGEDQGDKKGAASAEGSIDIPLVEKDKTIVATAWDAPVFTAEKGFLSSLAVLGVKRATTADLVIATIFLLMFGVACATMHWPEHAPAREGSLSVVDAWFARKEAEEAEKETPETPAWKGWVEMAKKVMHRG